MDDEIDDQMLIDAMSVLRNESHAAMARAEGLAQLLEAWVALWFGGDDGGGEPLPVPEIEEMLESKVMQIGKGK
jgi:hypothetical protein